MQNDELQFIQKHIAEQERLNRLKNVKGKVTSGENRLLRHAIGIEHITGLSVPKGQLGYMIFDDEGITVYIGGKSYGIGYVDITDITVANDIKYGTNYDSSLTDAVAGYLAFGTVGAIVGSRPRRRVSIESYKSFVIMTYEDNGLRKNLGVLVNHKMYTKGRAKDLVNEAKRKSIYFKRRKNVKVYKPNDKVVDTLLNATMKNAKVLEKKGKQTEIGCVFLMITPILFVIVVILMVCLDQATKKLETDALTNTNTTIVEETASTIVNNK